MDKFEERRHRIIQHHLVEGFAYPSLSQSEKHTIRVIAETLYKNVQTEVAKSLLLYEKLDQAFGPGFNPNATQSTIANG